MVPLSILTKLQNMSKCQDDPILHLVTSFADLNSLALDLQTRNFIFRQNCNYQLQ